MADVEGAEAVDEVEDGAHLVEVGLDQLEVDLAGLGDVFGGRP